MVKLADDCKVDVIEDYRGFLSLEKDWNRLLEDSDCDSLFLRHEWFRIWWKYLVTEKTRPRIYLAMNRQGISAIAPLLEVVNDLGMNAACHLRSMTHGTETPRYDFICRSSDWMGVSALFHHWLEGRPGPACLELHCLPGDSRVLKLIQEDLKESAYYYSYESIRSPYIEIGADWLGYYAGLDGKFKRNLKNREKRIRSVGPLSIEVVASAPDLEEAFEECLRIESSGWKGEQKSAIACNDQFTSYYKELSEEAWTRGWLRIYFLKIGDRRIAFDYILEYGKRDYLLKTGYDPEFFPYSPGQLLKRETVKAAFDKGMKEYDFLGETMNWKQDWTPRTRPYVSVFLYRKDWPSAAVFFRRFGWKKVLKRVLNLPTVGPRGTK